jgi:hypothetical protein
MGLVYRPARHSAPEIQAELISSRAHHRWVHPVRGPHGQVHVRGVEIPRTWGPGKSLLTR